MCLLHAGVPVNLNSYTATIMSQLAFCPMMVLPRTLGAQIDPLIVDADLYTNVGDKVCITLHVPLESLSIMMTML